MLSPLPLPVTWCCIHSLYCLCPRPGLRACGTRRGPCCPVPITWGWGGGFVVWFGIFFY